MALTPSSMVPLGTPSPPLELPDFDGNIVSLRQFAVRPALLVAFWCNHCPYVQHVRAAFTRLARDYQANGVAVIAVNSNDFAAYPDDSPARMKEEAAAFGYGFPYLVDESQEVARAYRAACTPDFFLFDADRKLVYRGQMDASRPGNGLPNDGADLRAALDAALAGVPAAEKQRPSVGCNIKWKPGNSPFGG